MGTVDQTVPLTYTQLSNLLDIQNQENSRETSTRLLRLLDLTQEGVDDSATVKIVTVFTLIFLPASFMAVSGRYIHIRAQHFLIQKSRHSSV